MIGDAAQAAYLDPGGKLKEFDPSAFFNHTAIVFGQRRSVLEMKAMAMATAVKWTERLWLEAWNKAYAR